MGYMTAIHFNFTATWENANPAQSQSVHKLNIFDPSVGFLIWGAGLEPWPVLKETAPIHVTLSKVIKHIPLRQSDRTLRQIHM